MRLLFKQRFFSWLDSYDIFDEQGETVYTVKGQLALGHCLHIYDRGENHVGTVRQKLLTLLPKFEIYVQDNYIGCIQKELTFFKPRFHIDCNGWSVEGNFWEWDYQILDGNGRQIATVSKDVMHWTDHYAIDVANPQDALYALMLVLAIDAEKCSRN